VANIYGVSDDEIVHYQSIFSESGNTGAQVSVPVERNITLFYTCMITSQLMLGLYYMFGISGAQRSFRVKLSL